MRPVLAPMTAVLKALLLVAFVLLLAPAAGQAQQGGSADAAEGPDYADWEAIAIRAEVELENRKIADDRLEELRGQLADWRARLLSAQSANSARIATLKEQIAALGPAPAEGETEAEEIAARRKELADQLERVQAPGVAAVEAYRRADGLIREIDRVLRERQADELLQLWPSPVNPANWPEAAVGLSDTVVRLWDETAEGWSNPRARATFFDNLPLILTLLVICAVLTIYARHWIEVLAERLQGAGSQSRRQVLSLLTSLGQVVVPTAGMVALSAALGRTGLLGDVTGSLAMGLPVLGLAVFLSIWLGGRAFPKTQAEDPVLPLPSERRAEGRFLSMLMGLVVAADGARSLTMDEQAYSDAVTAVATFPILVAGGLVLWRMGRLMRQAPRDDVGAGQSYVQTLLRLLARALTVLGPLGVVVAAAGYVAAGRALIFPAILSLGLLTIILISQRLLALVWSMISPADDKEDHEGLVPVLLGFGLTVVSMPIFALIWGARLSDLTELWTRFREGFTMGETRISPTDFILFAVIFIIGYMLTRLFQGALRTTILPKTSMERGGQTALVSGTGYVGIFLSALIAINATGIDLSGLAIVAGALSVGIGFGLQTIVSNFVSGIILLIERPVSEGDWIEVGGVQGIVKAISVRSTRIQTFDRTMVIVPNADLVAQRVTNWTRFSLAGRLIVPVSVAFGTDTRKVERILREIAEAQPLAVMNPPPVVAFQGFGRDAMLFEIRVILRDVNFSLQVKSDIYHQIVERFAAEGIDIPYSQSEPALSRATQASFAHTPGPVALAEPEAPVLRLDDEASPARSADKGPPRRGGPAARDPAGEP